MEFDFSKVKFSHIKSNDKEFDVVEKGIFKGQQSNTEFILNNWGEVVRRFHLLCLHQDKCEKAFAKETKKFNKKRTKKENEQAKKDFEDANKAFESILTDKGKKSKQDEFHSMDFDWKSTVDIPDDALTRVMLATIDMNVGTRRLFSKLRGLHDSVVGFTNLVTSHVEEQVDNYITDLEDRIDDFEL